MDEKSKMLARAHEELKTIPMQDGLSRAEENRRFDRRLTLHKGISDYLSRYVKEVRIHDKKAGDADKRG